MYERLVQAEAVPPVRRIPRVFSTIPVQMPESVWPASVSHAVHPNVVASVKHRRFFVDPTFARVGISNEHPRCALPRPQLGQKRRVELPPQSSDTERAVDRNDAYGYR
jgi:hypothetical protein